MTTRAASSTSSELDERRWGAVEARDREADGTFVFAVRTTGIYCRPSCRSRRPNRANVSFFEGPEPAERAGFRPCKRCEPRSEAPPGSGHGDAVALACSLLEAAEEMPLGRLAAEVGLSPGYFHRVFKRTLGVTPKEYAMTLRTNRLREALVGGKTTAGGLLEAGFGSIGRGYDESARTLGMTPRQYRDGGESQSIRFAIAESSLGWVLVASTERGVCSIELGDSREELERRLMGRFPKAELAGDDPDFADHVRKVVAVVDRPSDDLGDLPLDIRGTAFQRQVWDALRAIPKGSTASYADVARAIGRPSASRAVAGACASNELAVVIPCHRVIRGDGGLGGYRWGIGRKRALLDEEAKP